MSSANLLSFVDVLRVHRFLGVDQVAEVSQQLVKRCTDARGLARALMRRGWLTVYQTNRLLIAGAEDLVWGEYRVLDRLGTGPNSQVHTARHVGTGRVVALKT